MIKMTLQDQALHQELLALSQLLGRLEGFKTLDKPQPKGRADGVPKSPR